MNEAHLFDINAIEWADHPNLPGLKIKGLEGRAAQLHLSFTLVRVEAGGVIPRHAHETATETAFVVAGQGELSLDVDEAGHAGRVVAFAPGVGVSVPSGPPQAGCLARSDTHSGFVCRRLQAPYAPCHPTVGFSDSGGAGKTPSLTKTFAGSRRIP